MVAYLNWINAEPSEAIDDLFERVSLENKAVFAIKLSWEAYRERLTVTWRFSYKPEPSRVGLFQ